LALLRRCRYGGGGCYKGGGVFFLFLLSMLITLFRSRRSVVPHGSLCRHSVCVFLSCALAIPRTLRRHYKSWASIRKKVERVKGRSQFSIATSKQLSAAEDNPKRLRSNVEKLDVGRICQKAPILLQARSCLSSPRTGVCQGDFLDSFWPAPSRVFLSDWRTPFFLINEIRC